MATNEALFSVSMKTKNGTILTLRADDFETFSTHIADAVGGNIQLIVGALEDVVHGQQDPVAYAAQALGATSVVTSPNIGSGPVAPPSMGSFPALGLGKVAAAKVHPETSKSTGRFNGLEEVIDVDVSGSALKPAFSYSSMASKVVEAPMKKIIEEKKAIVKSNKIDTKGKKVYMTQQQYLYDGHKYNADDVVIVDDNGQELYFSDDDNDCNDSDDDNNNDNDDGNEAW
jgi:hypothetical protein